MVGIGVGKNMVTAVRFWAEASRVITSTSGSSVGTTPFGRAVFADNGFDPFLDDVATLWIVHWHIAAASVSPLFAWQVFFGHWMDPDFTRSSALSVWKKLVDANARKISEVTLEQHFDVFLHTYVPATSRRTSVVEESLDSPLTELELIRPAGERRTSAGVERVYDFSRTERPSLSNAVFAYCIADYWARVRSTESTLGLSEITTARASVGQIFRMTEADIRARLGYLDVLSDGAFLYRESRGVPVLERKRMVDPDSLLPRVYGDKAPIHARFSSRRENPTGELLTHKHSRDLRS